MTQQARTGYRKHRKATWGLALVVALAIAAVFIPFASGGSGGPQTYTFTGDSAACAGTTSVSFNVTLTNTSKTQNLGSADLYAPANISLAGASISSGGGAAAQLTVYPQAPSTPPGDTSPPSLISLRNLVVPGGSSVVVHVTASVTGTGGDPASWYSIAKQANSFNPGSLDLSNAFTLQGRNPTFTVTTCTLQFVTQPANPWQKTKTLSSPVSVAVFAGTTPVDVGQTPAPVLTVAPSAVGFSFGDPTYNSSTHAWSWPDATPGATVPSGFYNLTATLGSMTATSDSDAGTSGNQPFQITDSFCPAGQNCPPVESNSDPNAEGSGALGINNTLPGPVTLDFGAPGPALCDPWPNRASYIGSSGPVYFPTVVLSYNWGQKVLQVTYYIRNSEWVLTNTSRGNQDAEFCVGAHHQVDTFKNGDPQTNPRAVPFNGKYGLAHWNGTDFYGVVNTVSNPSKVGADPVVCGRGTQYLTFAGVTEQWRSWTLCIPFDWDIGIRP